MRTCVLTLTLAGLVAGSALATDIDLTAKATANNSSSITVSPGAAVPFRIEGLLSSDLDNEGLALIGLDLRLVGPSPSATVVPLAANTIDELPVQDCANPTVVPTCANPMPSFMKNLGITNPAGFKGTLIGGVLVQVGGGGNSINNDSTNAAFPCGDVIPNIAHGGPGGCPPNGPAIIATGSLTAPATTGTYTLQIENVFANVIRQGETGATFWATEAAGVGMTTGLEITVQDVACAPMSASTPAFTAVGSTTVPAMGTIWRTNKNVLRLNLGAPVVVAPTAGQIEIRELLTGGAFGSDLSAGFTYTLENGGNILKIAEAAATLGHRKWYAIMNTGGWTQTCPFEVHFPTQVGDTNGDNRVTSADVLQANSHVPCLSNCGDQRREDVNSDGRVTSADVLEANSKSPSLPVPKPSGH